MPFAWIISGTAALYAACGVLTGCSCAKRAPSRLDRDRRPSPAILLGIKARFWDGFRYRSFDESSAQMIRARREYDASELRFDERCVDILEALFDGDGTERPQGDRAR